MTMFHILPAYIDPGTGALVLQLLVAGILGAGVFMRGKIQAVLSLFSKSSPKKSEGDSAEEDPAASNDN